MSIDIRTLICLSMVVQGARLAQEVEREPLLRSGVLNAERLQLVDRLGSASEGDARDQLARHGIRAAPELTLATDAEKDDARRGLLREAYAFELPGFAMQGVTLSEACRRLTEISGVEVQADGEGDARFNLVVTPGSFWSAVLEVCHAAGVGLAPHYGPAADDQLHSSYGGDPFVPGTVSRDHPVILGPSHPVPRNAAVDGPVLVSAEFRRIPGERAATMTLVVRYVPDLAPWRMTVPTFIEGSSGDG
ncbi:MAG: hypothetical protein KDB53_05670 [Planctomycetes bacterium]|nr:hypothetical protein [Planctomycetota bacterium]